MKFWELDGAYFRGKDYPVDVFVNGQWKPYEGDKARVKLFGTEIDQVPGAEAKDSAKNAAAA